MGVSILCVGDIHLGRQPSSVPDGVLEQAQGQLDPAAAWRRAVEEALALEVDAVLLAGDVVEQSDDFYEAYGDLCQGVERLAGAGIAVIGVSGNHDVEVLPRLADAIPKFRLLGRGGAWEETVVTARDGEEIEVVGWSFPAPRVRASPLAEALPPRQGNRPRIGLLHCDRDQAGSPYAPVRSAELEQAPVDAWLLGHMHAPDALDGPRPIGYLGSLVGLDPTETGAHGPWLIELSPERHLAARQLALAPLRWERLAIALDALESPDEVHGLIVRELDRLLQRVRDAGHAPRAIGCRIHLTGRTAHRTAIARALAADDPREHPLPRDDTLLFVNRVRLDALPAIALDELATASDPAGLLARKVVLLRGAAGGAGRGALVEPLRRRFAELVSRPELAALGAEAPDAERTADLLESAALRVLDALLAQREARR